MKLELIRNAENRLVGYKLLKEATDDLYDFESVRNMIFFGCGDDSLTYDGRKTDDQDYTVVRWVSKSHQKIKRLEEEIEFEKRRTIIDFIHLFEPNNKSIYKMSREELTELAKKYGYITPY